MNLAKLRIAPSAFAQLAAIADAINRIPKQGAETDDILAFLVKVESWQGVGVRTAVCMLARDTGGRFPPIDEKIVPGMEAWSKHGDGRTALTATEAKALLYQRKGEAALRKFAEAFCGPALAIWREAKKFYGSNKKADDQLSALR